MGLIINVNNNVDIEFVISKIKDPCLSAIIAKSPDKFSDKLLFARFYLKALVTKKAELIDYDSRRENLFDEYFMKRFKPSENELEGICHSSRIELKEILKEFVIAREYDFLNILMSEVYSDFIYKKNKAPTLSSDKCPFDIFELLNDQSKNDIDT